MSLAEFTDSDEPDHVVAKRTIAWKLQQHHRGRADAVSSKELAEYTPVSASTVRDLVPEVRREYGVPIASSNGYYVAETRDEATRFIERQKQQARTSKRTAEEFAKAWNRSYTEGDW